MRITDRDQRWMAETRVMTPEEFEQMRAAIQDPDYIARLAAEAKSQGLVEVDNPMRREVRPRRGTETSNYQTCSGCRAQTLGECLCADDAEGVGPIATDRPAP